MKKRGFWIKSKMTTNLIFCNGIIAFVVLYCFVFISPAIAEENPDSIAGKVQLVSGESWVLKYDQSKISATRGMLLKVSDTVVTGDRGRVKLMMIDGTTLFVSRNSRLEAKRYALTKDKKMDEAALDLFWGKVRFQVKHLATGQGSFQMRTTTAVMGIRGTSGIFTSEMLPSDNRVRLTSQTLQSIPSRPSQLVLTSGLVSMQSLITGTASLVRAGETAIVNVRGALQVRPSRHRDLYLPPKHGIDDNEGSSSTMPPPPVEHDNQTQAVQQAKETFHQQTTKVMSEQKVNKVVAKTGTQAVKRVQQQAQVQVQQQVNSTTSVVIVPTVVGP